jgi:hypothetical protein
MSHSDPYQDPISAELLEQLERIPQEVDRSLLRRKEQTRLQSILYLVPFAGFVPAIWTLYHKPTKTDRAQRQSQEAAQLAVSTGGLWAIVMVLLTVGVPGSGEGIGITPLVLTSLLTSGYFLTNVWLMIQVLRRQRMYLPGLSEVGQRLMDPRRKHRP